jgi:hypothetical protein
MAEEEIPSRGRRHGRRRHRSWWKRRQFWVAVIAIIVGIFAALWLISSLTNHKELD